MIKDYISITKPGIIFGNAITVVAGFFLASQVFINWTLLFGVLLGVSLVMASGCVFNNYIDRDIDAVMDRTKNRALIRGTIAPRTAIVYGIILAILGVSILTFYTNLLTVSAALLGLFVYVIVYTLWLKRNSGYGVFVGSIAGAMAPVAGYLAVSGRVDISAIILFCILVLWQIPHSFAFAIYRMEDFIKAGVFVLPFKKSIHTTKIIMVVFVALFIVATLALSAYGHFSSSGLMLVVGLSWLALSIQGFKVKDDKRWAHNMFFVSIVVIVIFSAAAILGR
ncbi:MAG: heme o synthase [Candidatus Paceibacterota bacterium]